MVSFGGVLGGVAGGATVAITIKAIDEFSGTFNKATSSLTGFAGVAGKAGIAAIAGVGVALAGVGVASIKAAGDFEQTKIAFTTMLGSAEEADKMLKELAEFAKKTPFTLTGIEEQSKKLLAYGISADSLMGDIKTLGDIAAGVGTDKLPQLTLAFGQVSAAGKLRGQEIRQFTEAGVPILQALADTMGKTTAEIQEMTSAGEIGFEDVRKALNAMTIEGGRFENLMAKQAETVGGKFSNLQDTLQLMSREIGNALLPIISNLADIFLNDLLPSIQPLIPVLADLIKTYLSILAKELVNLVPALVRFVEFAIKLYQSLAPLIEPLSQLAFVLFDALIDILEPLIPVIEELVPPVSELLLAFVPLVPTIAQIIKLLAEMIASGLKNLGPVITAILPIIKMLFTFLEAGIEVVSKLIGWIKTLVEWINKINLGVISKAGSLIGKGVGAVGKVLKVNDAIIRPNGDIIQTHPDDYLIATKNPGGMGGITINIESVNGLDADMVAEALHSKLKNIISI